LRKKNPESGNQSYERNPKDKEPNCVHLCQLIKQMVKEVGWQRKPVFGSTFQGLFLVSFSELSVEEPRKGKGGYDRWFHG